eukprot:m.204543 g.204543  ORF g.204543 m.204543 type:complete len:561 (-) comp22572_c0_seq1:27-1709(-)
MASAPRQARVCRETPQRISRRELHDLGILSRYNPRAPSPFDWLSDELVELVLYFVGSRCILTTAHAVCTRWRIICSRVPVVIRADQSAYPASHDALPMGPMSNRCRLFNPDGFAQWMPRIASRFPYLRELPIEPDANNRRTLLHFRNHDMVAVLSKCADLRVFTPFHFMSEEVLLAVAEHCPNLEMLSIMSPLHATDTVLTRVAHGCRKLRTLAFRNCFGKDEFYGAQAVSSISDDGLAAIGNHCRHIENLRISFSVSDIPFSAAGVRAFCRRCHLKGFRVETKRHGPSSISLAELVAAVVETSPGLLRLFVDSETDRFSGLSARTFANATRLTNVHISIVGCDTIVADTILAGLGTHCRALERLFCHSFGSEAGYVALISGCKRLAVMDAYMAPSGWSDTTLNALATYCPGLREVCLRGTCRLVTDQGAIGLALQCKHLKQIELHGASITSAGAIALCDRCDTVILDSCNLITEAAVDHAINVVSARRRFRFKVQSRAMSDADILRFAAHPNVSVGDFAVNYRAMVRTTYPWIIVAKVLLDGHQFFPHSLVWEYSLLGL